MSALVQARLNDLFTHRLRAELGFGRRVVGMLPGFGAKSVCGSVLAPPAVPAAGTATLASAPPPALAG